MPLMTFDEEKFLLIKYSGGAFCDQTALKDELEATVSQGIAKDTVLVFLGTMMMYSAEIGIVVQFLKHLQGTGKKLHLVASNCVCQMLKTINVHKIPGLELHNSLESVQKFFPRIDLSAL